MGSKSYTADAIQVLEGLEAVRKRPGMYIGSTSARGLHHLIFEIVDNCVDEHIAGYCSDIFVSMNEDGSITVSDNGRGVPVDIHPQKKITAERLVYGVLHAGAKFSDAIYKISGGLHGVGSAVVNALSKKMLVEIRRDGYLYKDSYEKGIPTTKLLNGSLPSEKIPKKEKSGTTVTFYPDDTIFDTVVFKESVIKQRLKEIAYLNPELIITFHNKRDGKQPEIFHEPGGLDSYVLDMSRDLQAYTPVIKISGEKEHIFADIVFLMTEDGDETIVGFVNSIKTIEGGTHINAFKQTFAKIINQYAKNELALLKEKDASISGNDTRIGMQAVISLRHPDPQFEGQTKQKLGSNDVMSVISSILTEQLTVFFDRNATILEEIANRAVAAAKRKEQDKNKTDLSKKLSFEGNGKLTKQESNEPEKCEIFFVEGNSAGGSARKARNRKFQAVLPMRGKIINVEKAPIEKVLENEEIKSIISALGCGFLQGYNDDFDISKLKYKKIIIMTDADVDGSHIAILLLTFFYRFYPELINAGYVYLAVPPLYRASIGKVTKYLYNDAELEQFKKEHKGKLTVQRYKGLGEMDAAQLRETTMDPEKRTLKQVYISDFVESNHLTRILMGTEVAPRRQYIEEHALEAVIDL